MIAIEELEDHLNSIAAASSVRFADLAAGNEAGIVLRVQYSAPSLVSSNSGNGGSGNGGSGNGGSGNGNSGSGSTAASLPDRRYLIASITKPIVAMMAVQLAAEGRLSLNQHVRDFVEGFHRGPLRTITVRHLLTHTSGLPDMLPNNNELRAQHATLSDFVEHTSHLTPHFTPGTNCQYSSMGFAALAVIIEQITKSSIQAVMSERLFQPLSMKSSWLGLPAVDANVLMPTVLPCDLPAWQQPDSDWNWNSLYWRTLGAPWGGMISTAEDLGRLAVAVLKNGLAENGVDVLHAATVRSCTRNQTRHMADPGKADRTRRPWGLGWRLNWLDHSSCFSDFLSRSAFGHWGATGTMMWIDRRSSRWCVILTTQPYEESQTVIQKMSNFVAATTETWR